MIAKEYGDRPDISSTNGSISLLNIVAVILFLTIILSCQNETTREYIQLRKGNSLSIELDSHTGFYTKQLQFDKNENSLALDNSLVKRIQIYDLHSGELDYYIPYYTEGPNSIGSKIRGFHIYNRDSIFILSHRGKLSLINRSGIISKYWNLTPFGGTAGYPFPYSGSFAKLIFRENNIYISGIYNTLPTIDSGLSVLKLDLVTDSLSYTLKTPEWSKDYNWGGAMNYNFWDYDKNKDQLVVGFNNNSKVYIATFNSGQIELSNYFITNSDFFEEIIPYAEIGKRSTLKNAQNYFLAYPRYYFTLFDPFRNLYYRLAMHPLTNDEISSGETRMNTSLLIYDEEFEKIGEFLIDNNELDFRMVFVSEEGIHIASKKEFMNDENRLVFETLIPNFNL